MIRTMLLRVFFGVLIGAPLPMVIHAYTKIETQQRQIDQLYNMVLTLVENQESTTRQIGLTYGKEYGFYFADYSKSLAVLEELDPKIPGYAKRNPRWVIVPGVDKRILDTWSNNPVQYGKYREVK